MSTKPAYHMMRLPEVMNLTGLSRSALYALVKKGDFPKQVQLGPRAVAWVSTDVENWLTARIDVVREAAHA